MSRVAGKRYFVYAFQSEVGRRFYVGVSEDPSRRLDQHYSGDMKSWTKRYPTVGSRLHRGAPGLHGSPAGRV